MEYKMYIKNGITVEFILMLLTAYLSKVDINK